MDDPLDAVAGNVSSVVVHCEVSKGGGYTRRCSR